MKLHNFNAGPAVLPEYSINATIDAIKDFNGLSILSISHRTKDFDAVMNGAVACARKLLDIPENYHILFVGGGASTQFYTIPYNFLKTKAAYLDTGTWAMGGIKEARIYGEVDVVASSKDKNYSYIPKNYTIPTDADYFETCCNNTIEGTEIRKDIDSPVPYIADMSSDIFSHPVDVSKYVMIFAGAQKNFAPAGVTMVIIQDEFMNNNIARVVPSMCDYRQHAAKNSMKNTPPVLPIFTAYKTMEWMINEGGVKEFEKRAIARADKVYDCLDGSKTFYPTVADPEDRSRMNICFRLKPEYESLEADFLALAKERGLVGIKGHRSVGGFRASCYNACPMEAVDALIAAINDWDKAH